MSEENPTPEPDPVDQTDDISALRHEAASRRRALRATESERDALKARLDERDKRDVEQMVATRLADPSDFWLSSSLDDMRAEDGTIDKDKAQGELEKLLAAKPHYRKPDPTAPPDLQQGATRGAPEPPKPPSFGETLKRGLRG